MKQQKFECESCRYQFSKWQGMCTSCRKWNTIVERVLNQEHPQISNQPQKLSTIRADKFTKIEFICGKLSKLFNNKLSTSALCLVYGEPGAGKSSLMSYVINSLEKTVLYISGEESIEQVGERLKRQGVSESKAYISSSTYIEDIEKNLGSGGFKFVIIDSIQTLRSKDNSKLSSQNEILLKLQTLAIDHEINIWIIGHVNKAGKIAGPKHLEHMVDVVLSFSKISNNIRMLRAHKNRFAPSDSNILFNLNDSGLSLFEVSKVEQLSEEPVVGRVHALDIMADQIGVCQIDSILKDEKRRKPTQLVVGENSKEINFLIEVLDHNLDLGISLYSVYLKKKKQYLNVENCDLAIMSSLVLSKLKKKLKAPTLFFGEVDVSGKVDANISSQQINQLNQYLKNSKYFAVMPAKFKTENDDKNVRFVDNIRELPYLLKALVE